MTFAPKLSMSDRKDQKNYPNIPYSFPLFSALLWTLIEYQMCTSKQRDRFPARFVRHFGVRY